MRKLLISISIIVSINSIFAQTATYDFRSYPVNSKLQAQVGPNFRYVAFVIKGIKTAAQKQTLKTFLSHNPNFKHFSINAVNEFHGFVNNQLKASDVRQILISQGFDFRFDKYKFTGCYLKEQLKSDYPKK